MQRKVTIALVGIVMVAAASLLVGTSGADVVSHDETDVLELEPAGEGTYAQIDDETGEIRIVVTGENPALNGEGVNDDAVTDLGPVFTVENVLAADSEATVWIEDGSEAVEFYEPGAGTIESEDEGAELQPGDSVTVAMRVDTREVDSITLDDIEVLATLEPAVDEGESGRPDDPGDDAPENGEPDDGGEPGDPGDDAPAGEGPDDAGSEAANSVQSPEPTATPTATPMPTETQGSESEPGATDPPTVTDSPDPTVTPGMGPRESRLVDGRAEFDSGWVNGVEFEGLPRGTVAVDYQDEPPSGVSAPPGEAPGLAAIDVPDRLSDRSATVEFSLMDDQLGQADPEDVALAHYDEETGWKIHEATVERVDGGYAFTAETDGFSLFAVTVLESSGAAEPTTATGGGEDESADTTGGGTEPDTSDDPWSFGDSPLPLAVLGVATIVAAVLVTRLTSRDR